MVMEKVAQSQIHPRMAHHLRVVVRVTTALQLAVAVIRQREMSHEAEWKSQFLFWDRNKGRQQNSGKHRGKWQKC